MCEPYANSDANPVALKQARGLEGFRPGALPSGAVRAARVHAGAVQHDPAPAARVPNAAGRQALRDMPGEWHLYEVTSIIDIEFR